MIVMKPLFLPSFSPVLLSCITWSEPSTIPGPAALGTAPHAAALLLAPAEWPWGTGWHAAPLSSWHNSSTSVSRKFNTDQKTAGRRVGHCHSPFMHWWLGLSPGGLGWLVGIASTRASHFKGGKRGVPGAPQAHSWEGEDGTLGSGCSVTPGSCCHAPDLTHTPPLPSIRGKGKSRVEPVAAARCQAAPGSSTSAAQQLPAPSITLLSLGKGPREAMPGGTRAPERWQGTDRTRGPHLATCGDLSEQRWTGAAAAFGGRAESSRAPSPAAPAPAPCGRFTGLLPARDPPRGLHQHPPLLLWLQGIVSIPPSPNQ